MNDILQHLTEPLLKVFGLGMMSFVLSMVLTPVYTYFAYKYKFWKQMRHAAMGGGSAKVYEKLHAAKHRRNIPTMAGLIFVVSIALVTVFANLSREQTWLPLAALVGCALVGLVDDIFNIRSHGKGIAGMRAPIKFALISLIGLILGWFFYAKLGVHEIHVPFVGSWNVGWWIIPIFAFVVVATGNAVNISDGLDGLSGGLAAIAFTAYAAIALLDHQFGLAGFCFAIMGALVSYIWFNIYPARFFMGDVGSFSLGCSLAVVAMLTDTLFVLPIIGIVFVLEAGSVIIQLTSKKLRHGKKIFLSAPVHHHLEAIGWPETKVTMRFWLIGVVFAIIGLIITLAGGAIK